MIIRVAPKLLSYMSLLCALFSKRFVFFIDLFSCKDINTTAQFFFYYYWKPCGDEMLIVRSYAQINVKKTVLKSPSNIFSNSAIVTAEKGLEYVQS